MFIRFSLLSCFIFFPLFTFLPLDFVFFLLFHVFFFIFLVYSTVSLTLVLFFQMFSHISLASKFIHNKVYLSHNDTTTHALCYYFLGTFPSVRKVSIALSLSSRCHTFKLTHTNSLSLARNVTHPQTLLAVIACVLCRVCYC